MIKIGIPYTGCEHISEIPCTSEPEAIAIACGIELGGGKAFVFMQDSGALNCINNIASLVAPYDFNVDGFVKEVTEPEHHKYSNELYRRISDSI